MSQQSKPQEFSATRRALKSVFALEAEYFDARITRTVEQELTHLRRLEALESGVFAAFYSDTAEINNSEVVRGSTRIGDRRLWNLIVRLAA